MTNEINDALAIILDYVERQNKQDADTMVANAAQKVEAWLATFSPDDRDI
jgi:hypothetical protein